MTVAQDRLPIHQPFPWKNEYAHPTRALTMCGRKVMKMRINPNRVTCKICLKRLGLHAEYLRIRGHDYYGN